MTKLNLIYGTHPVIAALKNPLRVAQRLWMIENHAAKAEILLLAQQKKITISSITQRLLDEQLGQVTHQGVLLEVGPFPAYWENDLEILIDELTTPARLLILDGVVDPHNLGACMRSADAAGVHAVIAPKDRACGLTPIVRKVACGAAENVPFIQVTNLARTLRFLKEKGVWIYGLSEHAQTNYTQMDYTGSIAIVMGAEGEGLRRMTTELCDHLISIPMLGSVDCLNVSVATGVVLYEIVRQQM